MTRPILCALALAAALPAAAQQQTYGCNTPESRRLDFWLGDWDLSYERNGEVVHSRNRITKKLDGCVVLEEFAGGAGTKLQGMSVSIFDGATGRWKQTWVDNGSSYLDFDGRFEEGRAIFYRQFEQAGKTVQQRMVFQDIKADSLKWLWQQSTDAGKTWTTQWDIDYARVK